ncbi:hypothetical protein HPB48_016853 [Haemaphysalis longicornis]|uniref:Uncharacterized protein n=1 Tax=Haemaphysalis longicornis TaxID=44386 RepID=A0A9J6FU01_HAELO|nr:hypothetical protein HPB48_016853 [Haemaphysalis longicornis]
MGAHGVAAPTSTMPELKVKTLEDIERMAVAKLDPGPRAYYTMGADQEQTLAENKLAFKRYVACFCNYAVVTRNAQVYIHLASVLLLSNLRWDERCTNFNFAY